MNGGIEIGKFTHCAILNKHGASTLNSDLFIHRHIKEHDSLI